jgi:hypothetical protein
MSLGIRRSGPSPNVMRRLRICVAIPSHTKLSALRVSDDESVCSDCEENCEGSALSAVHCFTDGRTP